MIQIHIRDRKGKTHFLSKEVHKLGRALDNDIVIADLNISRYHLALQPTDNGLLISNTGSESGFHINGQWYMDNALAQSGDILRVGHEEFMVEWQESLKTEDFSFNTLKMEATRTKSLDVSSSRTKKVRIGIGFVFLLMVGLALMPETNQPAIRIPASITPTQGLPTESYTDLDVPRLGPQELTADDLYKRGLRELSTENYLRAIQYFQQSLVEDPSLVKSNAALRDAESALKKQTEDLVMESEKNFQASRLTLSRTQANQALNLLSEQIPGFSFQVQQKQRTLATQRLPVLSREHMYLDMKCDQTPEIKLCERAVEVLKRSRIKLGEENTLK